MTSHIPSKRLAKRVWMTLSSNGCNFRPMDSVNTARPFIRFPMLKEIEIIGLPGYINNKHSAGVQVFCIS